MSCGANPHGGDSHQSWWRISIKKITVYPGAEKNHTSNPEENQPTGTARRNAAI
jgi:hypothetical protein